MRVNHGPNQPESRRQPRCYKGRKPAKHIRSEENATQRRGVHAEAKIKPVCGEALDHEAAAKCVESKQARQLEDDSA